MTKPDPLLPRVPRDVMPKDVQVWHDGSTELRGEATFFEVMANNPDLLRWYIDGFYGDVFRAGRVPRIALEVLRLRLSVQNGCRFCNQGNRVSAREAGLTDGEIEALFADDDASLRPELRPVAALADTLELTNSGGTLSANLYDQLRRFYEPGQIVELGMIGGVLTGVAKFLFAFDLVEREVTCPFPRRDKNSV
ncbi:MAG: carboxymuconolactone decarboxylase family protein [Pseudomonadota bacterium]